MCRGSAGIVTCAHGFTPMRMPGIASANPPGGAIRASNYEEKPSDILSEVAAMEMPSSASSSHGDTVKPKCGMALEPRTATAGEEENPELVDMGRRFWISVALTIPLVVIAMGGLCRGIHSRGSPPRRRWAGCNFSLPLPSSWPGGWPFFVRGWQSVVHRSLNMFTLIGLGVGVAFGYSLVAVLFPEIFPTSFRDASGAVAVYFEAAAAIVTLVLFGQVLELKARIENLGIDPGKLAGKAEALRKEGQTVMFVGTDGKAAGLLGVADPVKGTTPEAIRQFHEEGIRIVMLTGDSRTTAEAVAGKLDIDEVIAEVLPDQKADAVKRLQGEGRIVAMAGDGINDAPALAQAQVGIAMGTGTDVAMESAGVTLVKGDLRGIVRARKLSRATMRNIKQNLFFAFAYNALGVPIAAGVLYPFLGILLSPVIAAAAMSFSSVSVVGNALRLRREKL